MREGGRERRREGERGGGGERERRRGERNEERKRERTVAHDPRKTQSCKRPLSKL